MVDRWLQENVQHWIGSWLDSRRRPKKGRKNTSWDNSAVVFFSARGHHLSLSLSFLSPFLSVSVGTLLLAPPQLPRLYKRARATTCFLLSPPLDRVQRVPLLFPQPFVQPTGVISHAVFPPLFSYVSLSPMRYNIHTSALFSFSFFFSLARCSQLLSSTTRIGRTLG